MCNCSITILGEKKCVRVPASIVTGRNRQVFKVDYVEKMVNVHTDGRVEGRGVDSSGINRRKARVASQNIVIREMASILGRSEVCGLVVKQGVCCTCVL